MAVIWELSAGVNCTLELQRQQSRNFLPQVYAGHLQHIWV